MELNKQQKESLKLLIKHEGFKVLEAIAEYQRQCLLSSFESLPLGDKDVLQSLSQTQNFNKGMRYLLDTAKAKTQEVTKAPDMH